VTTGTNHTCGINNGALYCWGSNAAGQRGDGNTGLSAPTPLRIGFDSDWSHISAITTNTCGLRGDQLYCWGTQVVGVQYTLTPTHIPGSWSSIAAGITLCGIQSGGLYCWGSAYLGNGTAQASTTPLRIGTDSDWQSVSTANSAACGVRSAGTYCWGANSVGQLGDGTTTLRTSPVQASTASDWAALELSYGSHVCGVRPGIGLLCWGADDLSQLGDGYAVVNPTPQLTALP
jgi:alpha-tubulin suppressor-like RCC1 family protein